MAMFIVKPWYRKKDDAIYGAEWAGTSDPSWVRTDDAVGFSAPNPYYSGMSTTPSSPFDNIMPWSGMRRVTDASAGELVEIPKFYYKWTRNGSAMKLQISMIAFDGSLVSPAHADRGDGVGERDYVYVGRYKCASDYKSKTGVLPKVELSKQNFRTSIHNLGNNIWQQDYAIWWTIRMLYLVEFAHWNSQKKIGYGGGNGSGVENMGNTDNMPYHTGTIRTSKSTYGIGIQYRYIEDLWANCNENIDGIYYTDGSVYVIKNPSSFADSSNGVYVGNGIYNSHMADSKVISQWTNPSSISGYEYSLFPSGGVANTSTNDYVCDGVGFAPNGTKTLFAGGDWANNNQFKGIFNFECGYDASVAYNNIGSRLVVLPSSQLT